MCVCVGGVVVCVYGTDGVLSVLKLIGAYGQANGVLTYLRVSLQRYHIRLVSSGCYGDIMYL